jgi:hypothetical protein
MLRIFTTTIALFLTNIALCQMIAVKGNAPYNNISLAQQQASNVTEVAEPENGNAQPKESTERNEPVAAIQFRGCDIDGTERQISLDYVRRNHSLRTYIYWRWALQLIGHNLHDDKQTAMA